MPSHTTKSGKAKCLFYRNNSRCGRIAHHEVTYTDRAIGRGTRQHLVVCDKCLNALKANPERFTELTVVQVSRKGFKVRTSSFGPVSREYIIIW